MFAGDDELGLGPDQEAIDAWLEIGVPRERIVECPRDGELLAGRPDRSLRSLLGAVPRPRRRARPPRRPPGRRQRALPGVLEPGVHAARPEPGRRADPAAGQEHRHRPRAQPAGGDPAGQGDRVRDRPVRAADRARRGALRPPLRTRFPDRQGAAGARRPRPRDDVPDRRRRRALQRGSRLRAAADHAPGDPAGPGARAGAGLPALATPSA